MAEIAHLDFSKGLDKVPYDSLLSEIEIGRLGIRAVGETDSRLKDHKHTEVN